MKRVKKPKQETVTMTRNKINKMKRDITDEAVRKATLLFLKACQDELDLGYDEVLAVFKRCERYSNYLQEHLLSMRDLADSLEKDTGIKLTKGVK